MTCPWLLRLNAKLDGTSETAEVRHMAVLPEIRIRGGYPGSGIRRRIRRRAAGHAARGCSEPGLRHQVRPGCPGPAFGRSGERNARVCVPPELPTSKSNIEKGSSMAFKAKPATRPLSLLVIDPLWSPPKMSRDPESRDASKGQHESASHPGSGRSRRFRRLRRSDLSC